MSIPYTIDFTEDPDPKAWVAVPVLEGSGAARQRRKWAKKLAEMRWALEDEGPRDKSEVKWLARVLEGFSGQFPQKIPMQYMFVYCPDLRKPLLPFFFYAVDSGDASTREVLDTIVQRYAPGAAQDPEIADLTTEHLGEGLRSIRYFVPKGEDSLICSVNYGWRVESHGIDLSMRTFSDDIGWVTANIDEFDEFTRKMKITSPSKA